jgi:hypothetical protein
LALFEERRVMDPIGERMARLEARVEAFEKLTIAFMAESSKDRKALHETLHAISAKLDSQRTFVGGVIFTLSAIWAAGTAIVSYLKGHP